MAPADVSFDPTADGVVAACEHFLASEHDRMACNFFVQDVCGVFGIADPVADQANDIAERIGGGAFEQLSGAAAAAERAAQDGWIVVAAAATPGGHGHVAIIIPGPLMHFPSGDWPKGYWGALSGKWSGHDTPAGFGPDFINQGFNGQQRSVIKFGALPIGAAG